MLFLTSVCQTKASLNASALWGRRHNKGGEVAKLTEFQDSLSTVSRPDIYVNYRTTLYTS